MARAPVAKSAPPSVGDQTRLLVLFGKERFLQDQYLGALRDALVKKHTAEGIDTIRFDGARGPSIAADVLDELRSFGLMQQYKVVLVDNADLMLKSGDDDAPSPAPVAKGKRRGPVPMSSRELLEAYTQSPSDSATLVLRANVWRPGNLDKAIAAMPGASGVIIECKSPEPAACVSWARRRAEARHKTTIDAEAATMLVSAVGGDLGRIASELEKLALAAGGDGQPITPDLVRTMTGMTREDEFWSIQGPLLSGDARGALTCLRDLIEVSRHDPVPLTFSITDVAKKVHIAAHAMASGARPDRVASVLRLWGPNRDMMLEGICRAASTLSPRGAADLLGRCIHTDAANKSGLGEPVRNVERLMLAFSGATSRGASTRAGR